MIVSFEYGVKKKFNQLTGGPLVPGAPLAPDFPF